MNLQKILRDTCFIVVNQGYDEVETNIQVNQDKW